ETVRCQIGLDELGMPARVVGLGHKEHDIEDLMHRSELAQMIGPHLGVYLSLPERHMEAVGAHGLDVRGPLVDEHDIEPGIREIGCDTTAVRAGTKNCDFLFHGRSGRCTEHRTEHRRRSADWRRLLCRADWKMPSALTSGRFLISASLRLQIVLLDEPGHAL